MIPQRVNNIRLWRKILVALKVVQGEVEPLTIGTDITPTYDIFRSDPDTDGGAVINNATSTPFGLARPGQRFCVTGCSIAGKALVTDATVIIYGTKDGDTSFNLCRGYSLVGSCLNIEKEFPTPLIMDENTDITAVPSGAGTGSVHVCWVRGFYL